MKVTSLMVTLLNLNKKLLLGCKSWLVESRRVGKGGDGIHVPPVLTINNSALCPQRVFIGSI
jgi:hypothetical protein